MNARQRYACDTSVAIAALDATHPDHAWSVDLVRTRRPALAGHAAIETFAVLTRLPPPSRLTPQTAGRVILHDFPVSCPGPSDDALSLVDRFAGLGIAGGSVYDGLVALAAHEDERVLLTRDQRAERTYRRLGIRFELLVGSV